MSDDIKHSAVDMTKIVDKMDVSDSPIHSRRWGQIDQSRRRRLEQIEAAKNREKSAKDREKREKAEREQQKRIRKNLSGAQAAIGPDAARGPQANGAFIVGEDGPRNQLKGLADKQLDTGYGFVASGRLNDAIREFRGALTLDPTHRETYEALALALTVTGEPGRAKPVLQSAEKRFGQDATSLALQAHAAWQEGDAARAAGLYAQVRSLPAPRAKKGRGRGKAPAEQGFLAVSRKAWGRSLVESAMDPDANLAIAQLDLFAGKPLAAMKRLEKFTDDLEGASAYAEACLFAAAAGEDRTAVAKALRALEKVEGSASFALQKRLRALARPKPQVAAVGN